MIKLKVSYSRDEELKTLLQDLKLNHKIVKVSKEYKKEGLCKRLYINLLNK